ncbi:hypothetical protein [Desulfobacter curvatus]|uniref:hypothetical protein n=1 Tax=Desulfobacter curvatus TaxID=2290 RepID=UPI00037C1ACF|nr:hypothetical protein [Desulfobacter curvatus]
MTIKKKKGLNSAATEIKPTKEFIQKEDIMNSYKTQSKSGNLIYLKSGFQVPKEELEGLENSSLETPLGVTKEILDGIETLTATELREKYQQTYNSWKNMKQRAKKGYIIHKDLAKFKDFLRHLGPCEIKNYTLDRLDNCDPEYAPGKVQWRDKYAQNSNKGNNVYLTHHDGRKKTTAQWAKITGQKATTLYARKKNGWTDMEIITGVRNSISGSQKDNPFPLDSRELWEEMYVDAYLTGYKKSKLEFVHDRCKTTINELSNKAIDLSNQLEFLEWSGDDDDDEFIKIEKKLKKITKQCLRLITMLREAQQQLQYENEKEFFLDRLNLKSKFERNEMGKEFEKRRPRPRYNVNQPDFKYKLSDD